MTLNYSEDDLNQAFYALMLLQPKLADIPDLRMDPGVLKLLTDSNERQMTRGMSSKATVGNLISETGKLLVDAFKAAKKNLEDSGRSEVLDAHSFGNQTPDELARLIMDHPQELAKMAEEVYRLLDASKGQELDTVVYKPPVTTPTESIKRIGHALLPSPMFEVTEYSAGQSAVETLKKAHYRLMLNFTGDSNDNVTKGLLKKFKAVFQGMADIDSGNKRDSHPTFKKPFISIVPHGDKEEFKPYELFTMADYAETASRFQFMKRGDGGDEQSVITRTKPK